MKYSARLLLPIALQNIGIQTGMPADGDNGVKVPVVYPYRQWSSNLTQTNSIQEYKHEKYYLFTLSIMAVACNSSSEMIGNSDTSDNALVGMWTSNCHKFPGADDGAGNAVYSVSELSISESAYVDNFISHTDINCTADPVEESIAFSYALEKEVVTTDGVSAKRITFTSINSYRPECTTTVEAIFRISNVDLNFGEFNAGEIPSIDIRISYTRQFTKRGRKHSWPCTLKRRVILENDQTHPAVSVSQTNTTLPP